jgi:hypothetical protein
MEGYHHPLILPSHFPFRLELGELFEFVELLVWTWIMIVWTRVMPAFGFGREEEDEED